MPAPIYTDVSAVVSQLDMAVLVRESDRTFLTPGKRPDWWEGFAREQANSDRFVINDNYPFLANFLIDAEEFWKSEEDGNCASGIWEQSYIESELLLEAFAFRHGDDELIIVENLRSTRSAHSELIRAGRRTQLELLRDISRRQQLELELRDARDAAMRLENARAVLLANTSHELRTPLAGLLGMLEIAISEQDSSHLQMAFESASKLQRIVNDLLDYAAMEVGRPQLELSEVSPHELVIRLAREFESAAVEQGLELQFDALEDSATRLITDQVRLRQILNNLVFNAIQYTDYGSVALAVAEEDDGLFRFSIRDTGPGIPEEEQASIFDAFQRGSTGQANDGGTGLGLAISAKLVDLLGGRISLESAVGEGTTFHVVIPSAVPEGEAKGEETELDILAVQPSIPNGLKILVAEDNPVNRDYLVYVLRAENAVVDVVDNGKELIDRATSDAYDVILTDCRMFGMGGLEAAAEIRRRTPATASRVPIIAVTAHAAQADVEPFSSSGIDDILIKPFTRAQLIQKIAALVSRKEAPTNE